MHKLATAAIVALVAGWSYFSLDYLVHAQTVITIHPIVIDDDDGGNVDDHVKFYTRIRDANVPVRIRGICLSACTIFLMLPKEQVCLEHTASLGFHLATRSNIPVPDFTKALIRRYYPPAVQKWIADKGELKTDVVYMSADELVALGVYDFCQD